MKTSWGSRALTVLVLGMVLAAAFCGGRRAEAASKAEPGPPTIVLIISDDQDYGELGFNGNAAAHTPMLDRLAREGAVFPVAHVGMSRCRPSLACLLAGTYPHQNGIYYNAGGPGLDRALDTMPRQLRRAGYLCWVGGKYWEGDPRRTGFSHGGPTANTLVRKNQEAVEEFLTKAEGSPAFLWWAPMLPHQPLDPPARLVERIDPDKLVRPPYIPEEADTTWRALQRTRLAMGAWLDEGVGELFDILEKHNRLDNTLVVFLIDNGVTLGLPAKGTPYEHGFQTPVVLWQPGRIAAGTRLTELVSSLDVVPTILDWAGADVPEGFVGKSLWPVLEGKDAPWRDRLFGAAYPKAASNPDQPSPQADVYALYVRTAKWKYILYLQDIDAGNAGDLGFYAYGAELSPKRAGQEELFDLEADPHELHDLSGLAEHEEKKAEFRREVFEWWTSTGGGKPPLGIEDAGHVTTEAEGGQAATTAIVTHEKGDEE